MRRSTSKAVMLVALGTGSALACVSPDEAYVGGSGGGSTSSGSTSSGAGGAGGSAPAGRSATQTVNAGTVAKNSEYRMVFTLGQPALSQQKGAAGGLRLQGGLIGATENTP